MPATITHSGILTVCESIRRHSTLPPRPTHLAIASDVARELRTSPSQEIIRCRCGGHINITETWCDEMSTNITGEPVIEGQGFCGNCVNLVNNSLTMRWVYSIITGQVKVIFTNFATAPIQYHVNEKFDYTGEQDNMPQTTTNETPKIYALTDGDGPNLHLLIVTSNPMVRDLHKAEGLKSHAFECPDLTYEMKQTVFPVYVVSVGVGERYRIIDILLDRKAAIKIATSVRGKMAQYDCIPGVQVTQDVNLCKYFVPLSDVREDRFFYVDTFRRRVSLCENEVHPPIVTRRRRYNSSLPYRFEVAAGDRSVAEQVARQIADDVEDESIDLDEFEYNVDYTMVQDGGRWVIDPQLLLANNVQ